VSLIIIDASEQQILTPQACAIQLASKLQWWYCADNLTVVNGLVAEATDLTGNNRDGVQGTVGNRLTYFLSDPMFGGRPSFGSTTSTGTRHLAAPTNLLYQHQIFSAYYKDGIDNSFDVFSFFSGGTGTSGSPRLMGSQGSANLINGGFYSPTISRGGAASSATVLPLPATVLTASGNNSFSLQIGGSAVGGVSGRVLVGAFRHFVGASQVLTAQEIQLIEGVIAWNDGTQNTLIISHPYRSVPPFV
jgi:hypothetical protein